MTKPEESPPFPSDSVRPRALPLAASQGSGRDPDHSTFLTPLQASIAFALVSGLAILGSGRLFFALRSLALVIFGLLPLLLGALAWQARRRHPRRAGLGLGAAAAIVAIGIWSFGIEPRWLEVTRIELSSPKLDRAVRVAVIADLQTDRLGAYERRALETVVAASPDLVLLTGDYLQTGAAERRRLTPRFQELMKPVGSAPFLGAYAVGGDVELYPEWPRLFDGTGVQVLETVTSIDLGPLRLTALPAAESRRGDADISPTDRFHVIFGHAPDFALMRPPADLLIAGHTHGGQVRLPFLGPILTLSEVPRSWAAGVTDLDDGSTLVVSRGIGMERGPAPRLRFLCRPEVVILDLKPTGL